MGQTIAVERVDHIGIRVRDLPITPDKLLDIRV